MPIDHYERASRAWPLLVQRARNRGDPYAYCELCGLLGLHHRAASRFLGVIQDYCRRHELPPLQALAVNKKTKLPGPGYVGSERTRAAHNRKLAEVRSERWQLRAPNFRS